MIELGILHIIIPSLLVVCAILIVLFKDLIAAAITLAAFSLLLALEFYLLQAPDVAIAEAGVGAAISTTIYILGIKATKQVSISDYVQELRLNSQPLIYNNGNVQVYVTN